MCQAPFLPLETQGDKTGEGLAFRGTYFLVEMNN